jgi:hypothetical protein
MTTRLHKVIHVKDDFSHFAELVQDGAALAHPDVAVDAVNTKWPDYDEICVETYSLDLNTSDQAADGVPHSVILRGHVKCCCGAPCYYAADHDLSDGGAFSKFVQGFISLAKNDNSHLDHAPGHGYIEGIVDLTTAGPLLEEANQCVPDLKQRAQLAAEIVKEATDFELTADNVESQLGITGTGNGLLSAPGAVAAVFAGTSTQANDYFWTALFVVLWQKFLIAAYERLTKDWPQRTRSKTTTFAPIALVPTAAPATAPTPTPTAA